MVPVLRRKDIGVTSKVYFELLWLTFSLDGSDPPPPYGIDHEHGPDDHKLKHEHEHAHEHEHNNQLSHSTQHSIITAPSNSNSRFHCFQLARWRRRSGQPA